MKRSYPIKRHAGNVLADAASTFAARRAIYGDNWKRVGEMTKALFPNGVKLLSSDDHDRFHILSLIMVKLSRYAVSWDRGEMHKDSVHDAAVYCAMLEAIDDGIKERENGNNRSVRKPRVNRRKKGR